MCPFCISALAIAAAKVVAAGGGGAILTKLALNRPRKPDEFSAPSFRVQESRGENSAQSAR